MNNQDLMNEYADILTNDADRDLIEVVSLLDAARSEKPDWVTQAVRRSLVERMDASVHKARRRRLFSSSRFHLPELAGTLTPRGSAPDHGDTGSPAASRFAIAGLFVLTVFVCAAAVAMLTRQGRPHQALTAGTPTSAPTGRVAGNTERIHASPRVAPTRTSVPEATVPPTKQASLSRIPPLHGLYAVDDTNTQLLPLDADTLARAKGGSKLDLTPLRYYFSPADPSLQLMVSRSRSVVAVTGQYGPDVNLYDTATGKLRSRIELPVASNGLWYQMYFNADGSKLAVMLWSSRDSKHSWWYVYDTRTGKPLDRFALRERDDAYLSMLLDPSGDYLYALAARRKVDNMMAGPEVPTLEKYDTRSGKLVGKLQLPGLLAGRWPTNREVKGVKVDAYWNPGLVLSSDGRSLAIVHADSNQITFVDTATMKVGRTITAARPKGLLQILGLAPEAAQAKGNDEGTDTRAYLSPDDKLLYVLRDRSTVNKRGVEVDSPQGIQVIDVGSGEILASKYGSDSGVWIGSFTVAPDGRSVYLYECPPSGRVCSLLRLDAHKLDMLAQRPVKVLGNLYFFGRNP